MPLDSAQIAVAASAIATVITAIGVAAERIITALRRHHGPPVEPSRRERLRKADESGDG